MRERESKPKRKEEKTEMVRIRRLNPGLVFRMVLESKAGCNSPESDDPQSSCAGSEGSEISAIVESDGSSGGFREYPIHRSCSLYFSENDWSKLLFISY